MIIGLVFEYTYIKPLVVQKLGMRGKTIDVSKKMKILKESANFKLIERWLCHSVNVKCNVCHTQADVYGQSITAGGEK